jgi:hypothetical protein
VKLLYFAFLLAFCLAPTEKSLQENSVATSIRHVTVINVANGSEFKDQTVTIHGDRIVSIAATQDSDNALPDSVDAHGAYLIPGLWDMHVHVHDVGELPLYIANGVTGIRIMSGEKDTVAYRAELARQQPSPEIYLASAIVDGSPPVWPGSIVVKKPDDARRSVDEIKAGGADFIKVYTRVPREAYFALADQAKQQHIDFEGHVPDAITAQEASNAGQRTMEHLQGIGVACSNQQQALMNALSRAEYFRDRLAVTADAYRSIDQAKCQALFAQFRGNNTWQVPTLSVLRIWGLLNESKLTSDPRLAYIGKKSRERWQERIQPQLRIWTNQQYQFARSIFSADQHIVGAMFRAGVPIMAGTDAMNPFCFPGFSLHDELAMMVDSGMTPLAVLQSATINPAKFLAGGEGKLNAKDFSVIEPGKIANLVLLRADPLADIHNTTQIQAVWLRGKYFDQVALAQLLETAKQAAKH